MQERFTPRLAGSLPPLVAGPDKLFGKFSPDYMTRPLAVCELLEVATTLLSRHSIRRCWTAFR